MLIALQQGSNELTPGLELTGGLGGLNPPSSALDPPSSGLDPPRFICFCNVICA